MLRRQMEIEEDMSPFSCEDKGWYFADAQIKRLLSPSIYKES